MRYLSSILCVFQYKRLWVAFRVLWSLFSLILQLLLHAIDTFNATVILVLGQVCSTTDSEVHFI